MWHQLTGQYDRGNAVDWPRATIGPTACSRVSSLLCLRGRDATADH